MHLYFDRIVIIIEVSGLNTEFIIIIYIGKFGDIMSLFCLHYGDEIY